MGEKPSSTGVCPPAERPLCGFVDDLDRGGSINLKPGSRHDYEGSCSTISPRFAKIPGEIPGPYPDPRLVTTPSTGFSYFYYYSYRGSFDINLIHEQIADSKKIINIFLEKESIVFK